MRFTTFEEQKTWDRLVAVAAGAMAGVQTMERRIERMKSRPVPETETLQDALDLLAAAEKSKKTFGQNYYAAIRTAHNLWPSQSKIGETLKLEAQLQVDRGKLGL